MNKIYIPEGYKASLDAYDTQRAIAYIKETFQEEFSKALNLKRVSAPLFVTEDSGLNDNLNGYERAVSFDIPAVGADAQVVHSLAKWKRLALKRYHFTVGNGLYTDMNAIRRDEELDNIHSIYVDQWDWEKVINPEERNLHTLKNAVKDIYEALRETQFKLCGRFPGFRPFLPEEITFVSTQELEDMYPTLTSKERENAITKEHKAVFIIGIGGELGDGTRHDNRAPDYDDYSTPNEEGFCGLNGDMFIWSPVLGCAIELSSMGIRVDREALLHQLAISGKEERKELYFHRRLLEGSLPLSIGGGLGQSRLCMLLLHKAHIGEIQASIWPQEMREECKKIGIPLI